MDVHSSAAERVASHHDWPFRFLDLPAELRNELYKLIIDQANQEQKEHELNQIANLPGLLFTSQQVLNEMIALYFAISGPLTFQIIRGSSCLATPSSLRMGNGSILRYGSATCNVMFQAAEACFPLEELVIEVRTIEADEGYKIDVVSLNSFLEYCLDVTTIDGHVRYTCDKPYTMQNYDMGIMEVLTQSLESRISDRGGEALRFGDLGVIVQYMLRRQPQVCCGDRSSRFVEGIT